MKRILDEGFGRKTLYELYSSTVMSSRLFYGLVQLEEKYEIDHVSWLHSAIIGFIKNNLKALGKYDAIFQSYLYLKPIYLIALLRRIGFYRKRKLIAVSHVTLLRGRNMFETMILKLLYGAFDTILFHSQKNMEESIMRGMISKNHCEVLLWGDDLEYIDNNLKPSQGDFFISTGREHRDLSRLISVFSQMPQNKLYIYTNVINYDSNYEYLALEKGKYSNVNIEYVEKSAGTTCFLAQRTAECLCVLNPLVKNEVYYCLGLTSIIEAMAMSKPIISSPNPYSPIDIEKEGIGIYVDDEDAWKRAIHFLSENPEVAIEMGKKGRKLAEEKFNINKCAKQIDRLINQ